MDGPDWLLCAENVCSNRDWPSFIPSLLSPVDPVAHPPTFNQTGYCFSNTNKPRSSLYLRAERGKGGGGGKQNITHCFCLLERGGGWELYHIICLLLVVASVSATGQTSLAWLDRLRTTLTGLLHHGGTEASLAPLQCLVALRRWVKPVWGWGVCWH